MDLSYLDQKYFIDRYVYNCPFCNRKNVSYLLKRGMISFDWTNKKKCFAYFAECQSCKKESMHLSFTQIEIVQQSRFESKYRFAKIQENDKELVALGPLDNLFFYSVPTSFFVLDKRIPKTLRELITEAEGCLKSNFLTGASACVRKVIYELAVLEKAIGENYEERIKSLKSMKSEVEPTFFDTLLVIQQVTSEKVHEQSYDGWESKNLRSILITLREILREIYIIPKLREEKRKEILKLKEEVLGKKPKSGAPTTPPDTQAD